MIMIILYIVLWLLSGFLAAWVMQHYLDEGKYDYTAGPVLVLSLLGGIALFIVTSMSLGKAIPPLANYLVNITIFKAKEPK